MLDAGAGAGDWSLELAARRPEWRIVGVDKDAARVERAEVRRHRLGLENVSFRRCDFLEFEPSNPFDVVLSVVSAHYLVNDGNGPTLFARFRSWLKPGGRLLLLGPRCVDEVPFLTRLARPEWHRVFTRKLLEELCRASGLEIERLDGRCGRLGTVAKQLDWSTEAAPFLLRASVYPLVLLLSAAPETRRNLSRSSAFWLLVARARA